MRWIFVVFDVLCILLGALWLLQGVGVVEIDPILCVGECQALEAPSVTWAAIGGGVCAVGLLIVGFALRRR